MTITGDIGELLAAVWYQGQLRSQITVTSYERRKARGHGIEILRDGNAWTLIAVNHPWTQPPTKELRVPYTTHGHWYGLGEPTKPGPRLVARCGGPHMCTECALEAHQQESEPIMAEPTTDRHPRIGDPVLYTEAYNVPGGPVAAERAAFVTEVDPNDPDKVGLRVLNPLGDINKPLAHGGVDRHDGDPGVDAAGEPVPGLSYRGGTWHWPAAR